MPGTVISILYNLIYFYMILQKNWKVQNEIVAINCAKMICNCSERISFLWDNKKIHHIVYFQM